MSEFDSSYSEENEEETYLRLAIFNNSDDDGDNYDISNGMYSK